MVKNIEINVQTRKAGKTSCQKLRKSEYVPGIIYGAGKKNIPLAAAEKAIKKYSSHQYENAIFTLLSDDKDLNGTKVLMKEVTVQPLNRKPVHVDFLAIDMNKNIRVFVELKFTGKAEGLSEGGILQPIVRQIEVECLPTQIPEFIAVDVTPLHVGQALHLKEITLPDGVRAVSQEDIALVTVTVIKDDVPATTVAATADAAATPAAGGTAAAAPGAPTAAAPAAAGKKDAAAPAAKK